jgi:y4mF family transcriptional regulator
MPFKNSVKTGRKMDMIQVDSMSEVADSVRRARKEQGISQTVLAQLSNVGLRFLCEVEHGKSTVRFDKLLSVLTSLGITLRLEMPSETSHA